MGLSLTGRKRKDTYTWLLQMQGAGATLDAETPIVICFGDGTATPLSLTTTGLFVNGSAVAPGPIIRSTAEGPPDNEVAESILSGNTLTESGASGTCPALYLGDGASRPATVNGKKAYYSEGSGDWSGLFPTGWRSSWTGTQWKTEYRSASFAWFEATSDDDVSTPDLATFDAPTEGTGTPDFTLTESIAPSTPVAIGQECRVGDSPETGRWFKAWSVSPVVWQEITPGYLKNTTTGETQVVTISGTATNEILNIADA